MRQITYFIHELFSLSNRYRMQYLRKRRVPLVDRILLRVIQSQFGKMEIFHFHEWEALKDRLSHQRKSKRLICMNS